MTKRSQKRRDGESATFAPATLDSQSVADELERYRALLVGRDADLRVVTASLDELQKLSEATKLAFSRLQQELIEVVRDRDRLREELQQANGFLYDIIDHLRRGRDDASTAYRRMSETLGPDSALTKSVAFAEYELSQAAAALQKLDV